MTSGWGLLGPEFLPVTRRTRTLNLGIAVREFNELAVPGMGGVWFAKQLLWPILGIEVAQNARSRGSRVNNIEVANGIETLACWLSFKRNNWQSDRRLRGITKLSNQHDFSFQRVSKRSFYVTQPMRMSTVQALPALGLVCSQAQSSRFNTFSCSVDGVDLINQMLKFSEADPQLLIRQLTDWVLGHKEVKESAKIFMQVLTDILSPLVPLPGPAIPLLREILLKNNNEKQNDGLRRENALAWVEGIRQGKYSDSSWNQKPDVIPQDHWFDLKAGALFFQVRQAALDTLDNVERIIINQSKSCSLSLTENLPAALDCELMQLKARAEDYLKTEHKQDEAKRFCRELITDPKLMLRKLVMRDGQVLRLAADEVKLDTSFRTVSAVADNEDKLIETDVAHQADFLPPGISLRMRNLYWLNLDFHGELDASLSSGQEEE